MLNMIPSRNIKISSTVIIRCQILIIALFLYSNGWCGIRHRESRLLLSLSGYCVLGKPDFSGVDWPPGISSLYKSGFGFGSDIFFKGQVMIKENFGYSFGVGLGYMNMSIKPQKGIVEIERSDYKITWSGLTNIGTRKIDFLCFYGGIILGPCEFYCRCDMYRSEIEDNEVVVDEDFYDPDSVEEPPQSISILSSTGTGAISIGLDIEISKFLSLFAETSHYELSAEGYWSGMIVEYWHTDRQWMRSYKIGVRYNLTLREY